jgi:hypothetical protein
MSRLEWLQMKRTCASYGPPLTPYEQIELFRLEVEHTETAAHRIVPVEDLARYTTPSTY